MSQLWSFFDTSSEITFVIYIMIFVGVLLTFEGVRQLMYRGETKSEARNRRMRMLDSGTSQEEVFRILNSEANKTRKSPIGILRSLMQKAGLPDYAWGVALGVILLGAALSFVLSQFLAPVFAAIAAFALSILVPIIVLKAMAEERNKKLIAQMPDALELMARSLRVGHPLAVTVATVATDMPDPIGSEFGIIQDQINFGDDVATAFRDFADRTNVEDTRFLAVSVGIQHGTGGNLARILRILAKVIRDRATMRKKIRSISSEGRLSAFILTILPFGIFGSIFMTSPSFYANVADDPLFLPLMGTVFVLIVLQGLILRRLVDIKY